jgi:hypothetical protein
MINAIKLTLLLDSSNNRVRLPLMLHNPFKSYILSTVRDLWRDAISTGFNYVPL